MRNPTSIIPRSASVRSRLRQGFPRLSARWGRRRLLITGIVAAALVGTAIPAIAFPNQTLNPDTGPGGSYLIAYHYADEDGSADWIRWTGGKQCSGTTGDVDYSEYSFSQEGANDEVSSFTDYNYCDTKWYINSYFGGGNISIAGVRQRYECSA